jgi:hypothetical protein
MNKDPNKKRPGVDALGPPWETTSSRELLAVEILIRELLKGNAIEPYDFA